MKRYNILLSTLIFSFCAEAQITVPTDIPSPNAVDLGEFGNVPVSYYTGKADISIPLYTLSVKGDSLPISLAYNSGGVIINKLPGWTGENWTLCAGGMITRIRHGRCDELVYPRNLSEYVIPLNMYNYFQSCGSLNRYLNNPYNDYEELKDSIRWRIIDLEPDVYHFNFLGHSGQFFLGNDGQWKVLGDENIEVIFDYDDDDNYILPLFEYYPSPDQNIPQPKTIKGFVLRDGAGMEYHFGGSISYIEYTFPLFKLEQLHPFNSWTANSWYLKEIRDRFGNTMFSFEYERGYFIAQLYNNAYNIKQAGSAYGLNSSGITTNYGQYGDLCPFDGTLNSPIYLKSILSASGQKIDFVSSDLGKYIEELYPSFFIYFETYNRIRRSLGTNAKYYLSSSDTIIRQYQYPAGSGYSNDPEINPLVSTQLRKLDFIKLKSTNGVVLSQYRLRYDTTSRVNLTKLTIQDRNANDVGSYILSYDNMELNDHISMQEDHWGYFTNNSYTLPAFNDEPAQRNYFSQRNPNIFSKKGMLTELVYPTGGKSVFEYENHHFSQCVSQDRLGMVDTIGIAGGVRIKSITDYEDSSGLKELRKRTFSYIDPLTNKDSGQLYGVPRYYWNCWQAYNSSTNTNSYITMFKNTSILPLSVSCGPHIGYSYIKETMNDSTYTEYRFSNMSSARDYPFVLDFNNGDSSPYDHYSSQEYKRGRLLSVTKYNDNGTPIRRVEYQYRTDSVETDYVKAANFTRENHINHFMSQYNIITGGVYKLFYPKYDTVNETCTTYYPSGNIIDVKSFNRIDRTLTTIYNGYTHTTDIRTTTSEELTRGNKSYKTIYSYPIDIGATTEQILSKNSFFLQPVAVEQKENDVTTYKQHTTFMSYNGLIVPQQEIQWNNGRDPDIVRTYLSYDPANGNLLTYQDQGQPVTTLEWTGNGCLLRKKTTGTNHFVEIEYDNNSQPLQIRSIDGEHKYYDYDDMGRLSRIRNVYSVEKEFQYNYKNK
ncbi:MAG: hypothetical protein IKQ59_12415 [Prevotella sp.]|nr:hypothetical protein [Prevotella sp.]MBR6189734.1 hypothetical protein [Prevotella sp.]